MAIINATDVVLKIDTAAGTSYESVLYATSASLSISRELRDSTTKDSSGFSESLAGLMSWELSSDSFVNFATATGLQSDELITEMLSGTPEVTVQFGVVGTKSYTGSAFITSISMDAGVEENATFSVTLQGTGQLT
jgi:TP901-1 family phage major tail protein